jgi:hypothetical protein
MERNYDALVARILDLCDQLLKNIAQSRALETKSE